MYYAAGDDDGLDRSLEAFARRHPEYNPADDPEVAGSGAVIVAAAYSRTGCDSGRNWDCVALAVIGVLGSPGLVPTAPTFSTDGDLYNTTVSCNTFQCTGGLEDSPTTWPSSPKDMDEALGIPGPSVPDLPTTPGRDKVIWQTGDGVKITYEQHPYHSDAPDFHRGPHWHLDSPWVTHQRYLPGDIMPRYLWPW